MVRLLFAISALLAGSSPLLASAFTDTAPRPEAPVAEGVLLAQSGDVEVYFDDAGNRFILDAQTGELIAVQPPRREGERRQLRRAERQRDLERYDLEDPEDIERLVRRRLDDLGLEPPPGAIVEIAPEPVPDVFPEAPPREIAREPVREAPAVAAREPATEAPERIEREERDPVREAPAVAAREPAREAPERIEREERDPVREAPAEATREPAREAPEPTEPVEREPVRRVPLEAPVVTEEAQPQPAEPELTVPDLLEQVSPPDESQVATRESELPEPGLMPGDSGTGIDPAATAEPPSAIEAPVDSASRVEVAELQILLDRVGASPGVIDGKFGDNVDKALSAYRLLTGENLKSTDAIGIKAALEARGGEAFVDYEITAADAAGPFVASVPADYGEKAKLERLSYTSVEEMLAERFHMDEGYLKALNPEANFGRAGTLIRVAAVGDAVASKAMRIIADKAGRQVRVFDVEDRLIAVYPATIGSSDTPSPTGTHKVARVALDPDYTYNPKVNFKQGENEQVLTIPPGPNGPVGSVWIALSKPTYGIHGTPDPSKIGKTESHGCVRLTNWDAGELAKIVSAGVEVEFAE